MNNSTQLLKAQQRLLLLARLLRTPAMQECHAKESIDDLRMSVEEFKTLAAQDDYPNEIEIYDKLIHAFEHLESLARFPLLAGRHIVAVGGAFSAGKSSFINSFLGKDILPTAIERTTALATYIVSAPAEVIGACTLAGRMQQLSLDDFAFLTHEASREYQINLSTFLRYLTLSSPDMPYQKLAFLDTPGYSADPEYQQNFSDADIAAQNLRCSDAIIWCIDCDNGVARQSDIQFLRQLGANRPVYLVLTKADMKPLEDTNAILKTSVKSLKSNGIEVVGSCLHSAHDPEYFPADKLNKFLSALEKTEKCHDWKNEIMLCLESYTSFHRKNRDKSKRMIGQLNKLAVSLA